MKSQRGFIILGGLYALAGALLVGAVAVADVKLSQPAQGVAGIAPGTSAVSAASTASDVVEDDRLTAEEPDDLSLASRRVDE